MSKRISEIVVVCEDQRHQSFINFYFKEWPVTSGATDFRQSPKGVGSAEQWVRETYVAELRAFRKAAAKRRAALLVIVDADAMGALARNRQFDQALASSSTDAPRNDEAVAILIPKRNIETWILLLGLAENVDELKEYRRDLRVDKRVIRTAARRLYELTRPNAPKAAALLPSLAEGIQMLRRFESAVRA